MDSKEKGKFSIEINPLNEKERAELNNKLVSQGKPVGIVFYGGFATGVLNNPFRVGPHGYLFWDIYRDKFERIHNFEIRSDDVITMGFLKSGTTWTDELVWLISNDLDFKRAKSTPLYKRVLFFGYVSFNNGPAKESMKQACEQDSSIREIAAALSWTQNDPLDDYAKKPSPRFLKTHIPFSLLPPNILEKSKVIYVARDPRDVAVSFYHDMKNFHVLESEVEFKDYWKLFKNNLIMHTPYFAHFREAWNLKDHPNMLFLFYEELSKDMFDVIHRVTKFLGKPTVTAEQMAALCEHLKFDNFKYNNMVNYDHFRQVGLHAKDQDFIRKGKVGDWRNYFDDEMARDAELWMEEELRGIDFRFEN